jgi:transmembrane sensor
MPNGADDESKVTYMPERRNSWVIVAEAHKEAARKEAEARHRQRVLGGTIATATAILAMGSFVAYEMSVDTANDTIATAVSESKTKQLKDGSVLKLQGRSTLRIDLMDERREVHLLEGAVTFAVAKDPVRPFVVLAHDVFTTAIEDAKFSVTIDSGVFVQVHEGVVEISRRGAAAVAPVITLKKGQRLRLGAVDMSGAVLADRSGGSGVELVGG